MKKAFTMIELVFVIVVIGILAAVIIPSTRTNPLQEAAIQVLSHIRYTQHLAMVDDKYNASDTDWYKGRWQMTFSFDSDFADNKPAYTIFSDKSTYGGDASFTEIAKNPENSNQIMTGGIGSGSLDIRSSLFKGMKKMNLGASYGVSSIDYTDSCSLVSSSAVNPSLRISFDQQGRPFKGSQNSMSGPYSATSQRLITSDCNVTLSNGSDTVSITIRPETGYSSINF